MDFISDQALSGMEKWLSKGSLNYCRMITCRPVRFCITLKKINATANTDNKGKLFPAEAGQALFIAGSLYAGSDITSLDYERPESTIYYVLKLA
jgi:hypothetical protein